MAVINFAGNQVAEWESIDDTTVGGEDATTLSGISTLSASDTVSIFVDDDDLNPDGTFDLSDGDVYITIAVNGLLIATGIKLKLETGGDSKEYGDTFFVTDDAVDLNGDGDELKLAFLSQGTFEDGEDITIIRDVDDDDDSDFSFICFAAGTLIATAEGDRPIEDLQPGHLVRTLEGGLQPVLWIGSSRIAFDGSEDTDPPVLIKAGSLRGGRPLSDLVVSSQHRILVGAEGQLENAFPTPGLTPAKSLTSLPGVRFMRGRKDVVWYHLLLERHSVILADGAFAESLLLGPEALAKLPDRLRGKLEQLERADPERMKSIATPVLPVIRVQQARRMVQAFKLEKA